MLIPDGFGQFNLVFTGPSVPNGAEVTLGFAIGPSVGDPAEAANNMAAALVASTIMTNISTELVISSILAKFGPNLTGPSALVPVNIPGTSVNQPIPPNVAVLVHKRTLFGGRTGQGRMYWPGVPDANVNGAGVLTGAVLSALQADFTALVTEMGTRDIGPVLLHSETSPSTPPRVITSLLVASIVGTQRRRVRR